MTAPITITGAALTLTVAGTDRSTVTLSATLTPNESRTHYHTIGGSQFDLRNSIEWNLDIEVASDVSKTTAGFVESIWTAASSAPNTTIAYVLTNNEVTFTGNLYPVFPSIGGAAVDQQTISFSFPTDGTPTAVWS